MILYPYELDIVIFIISILYMETQNRKITWPKATVSRSNQGWNPSQHKSKGVDTLTPDHTTSGQSTGDIVPVCLGKLRPKEHTQQVRGHVLSWKEHCHEKEPWALNSALLFSFYKPQASKNHKLSLFNHPWRCNVKQITDPVWASGWSSVKWGHWRNWSLRSPRVS